jgi:hypothetical protein
MRGTREVPECRAAASAESRTSFLARRSNQVCRPVPAYAARTSCSSDVFGASGGIATRVLQGKLPACGRSWLVRRSVWGERVCAHAIFNTWRRSKHCPGNVARACTSASSVAPPKPGTYRPPLLMHRARDFDDPLAWVAALDASLLRVTTRTSLEEAAPRPNGPIGERARDPPAPRGLTQASC